MGGPVWIIIGIIVGLVVATGCSIPLAHHHLIIWWAPWALAVCLFCAIGFVGWVLWKTAEGL